MKEINLIKDSAVYFAGKVIPGLVMFLSVPLFIRLFGESIYGEYSLIITTILLINTFLTGWINQSFLRFYTAVEDKDKFERQVYKTLFIGNVAFVVLGDLVLYLYNYNLSFILLIDGIMISLSIFSFQLVEFRTKFKAVKVVIADSIRTIIFIVTVLTLFYLARDFLTDSVVLILLANLVAYITGLVLLKPGLFRVSLFINILKEKIELNSELKKMLSYGLPIAFWMVAAYLLNISDRYIIKHFLTYKDVGEYVAVYDTFSKFMTLAFAPILLALQPRVISLFNSGKKKESYAILKKTIVFELIAFTIFAVIVYFTKGFIVGTYLKLSGLTSVNLVMPIFIGAFLWTISMLIHKPIELSGKTYIMLIAVILALIANVAGNIVFIPIYGVIAAAYTTIAGSLIYLIIITIYWIKK